MTAEPRGLARTTRNRPLECFTCGYKVRASRAMIVRGLPGCPCGERLIPAAIEDAYLAHERGRMSRAELDAHPEAVALQDAEQALTDAALKRGRKGDGRILHEAARCPSCHRYKRRPSECCGYCGDDPVRVGQDPREYDREHGWDWGDRDSAVDVDTGAVAQAAEHRVMKDRAARAYAARIAALEPHAYGAAARQAAIDEIPF